MDLRLLGQLEIVPRARGGELRRAKESAILAVLALTPGQVVTMETLIFKVWDDAPSERVKNTLRSYVSNVKGAVAVAGGASVESARGGYVLRIDRENVDVHRFHRLVARAEVIAASGDAERAVSLLREADGLWRDQALAGLPGRWIESMRHTLHEERRLAMERRVGLELELGRDARLISELWRLIEQYPLDEIWVAYQMQALYRVGRETEALALYQQDYVRRAELGLGPSPGLAALQERILRRDPSLNAASPARRAVRHTSGNGGLPPRPDAVVGRDGELAVLCDIPDTGTPPVRIIDGMGGSGKSTLAVEAAYRLRERCPDPPIFLSFHAHRAGQAPLDTQDALCQLLEMTGAAPEPMPQTVAALVGLWQREIAARRSVIVLDDVPDTAAIAGVLPAAGESVAIVTSRPRLPGLPGSIVLSLDELPLDDAIALFTRTAGSSKIDDPETLSRAVRLCGCLPLALTLSASRLRDDGSTVPEFVAEIEERRAFPDPLGMAVPGLMQTFELSYNGLDASHREFFRRLGVNPCPSFNPRTAAVIVGTTIEEAESALGILHGRHLVEQFAVDRYRFHDLIREYAVLVAGRDDPDWEQRRALHRLLDYYLNSARRADRLLYPYRNRADMDSGSPLGGFSEFTSAGEAEKWLELEWRNVVRLVGYASRHEWKQYCADLSRTIVDFIDIRGYWSDGIDVHRTSLQACRDLGDPLRLAQVAKSLSLFEIRTGSHRDAMEHIKEAAEIYQSAGDGQGIADSLNRMGAINRFMGFPGVALAYHQEALGIYRSLQDDYGIAGALCNAGAAYYTLGRHAEAIDHYRSALALYQEIGDRRGEARCLNNLGDALCRQGLYRDAVPYLEEAFDIYQKLGARHHLATVQLNMGSIDQSKGRYQDAIAAYRTALATFREEGYLRHAAGALYEIGTAYQSLEYYDHALAHYQEAEAIAKKIDDLGIQEISSCGIANALRGEGDYTGALRYYRVALELVLQTGDLLEKARVLEGMAETRFRMRDITETRILLREAQDAYRMAGVQDAAKISLRLSALDAQESGGEPPLKSVI